MQRQRHHRPADVRDAWGPCTARGRFDRAEQVEQLDRGAPGAGRGRVGEAQCLRRRTPRGELERQPAEVDGEDLGRSVRRAGAVLDLRPQPVAHAGLGAAGPSGPLVGRVAADRHRGEPRHPGADIEARRTREPAVDHDAHAVDGQRRLGDVGGEHDAATPGRRRREREVLVLDRQRTCERAHVDVGRQRRREALGGPPDLGDAGQEDEHVAGFVPQRQLDGAGGGGFETVVALARPPAHVDRERAGGAGEHRSGRAVVLEQAGEGGRVGSGRHRHDAQVGPQRGRDVERQRQAEVGREVALVHLVEQDRRHAGQLGVVLDPPGEHALGEHLDTGCRADAPFVAGLVADESPDRFAGELGHAPCRGARRQPPRFEHHDAAPGAPRFGEQRRRHERGLAGARRGTDHGARTDAQRRPQRGDHRLDVGQHDSRRGRSVPSVGAPPVRSPRTRARSSTRIGQRITPAPACRGTGRGRRRGGCRAPTTR